MALLLAPFAMLGFVLAQFIFFPLALLIMSVLGIETSDFFDDYDSDSLTNYFIKMIAVIVYLGSAIGMMYIGHEWGIKFFLEEYIQMFKTETFSMSVLTIISILFTGAILKLLSIGIYGLIITYEERRDRTRRHNSGKSCVEWPDGWIKSDAEKWQEVERKKDKVVAEMVEMMREYRKQNP